MHDEAKVDEIVLALLHLTAWQERGVTRAWKGFDWDSLDRLHDAGMIGNPKSKAKSVALTEQGAERSRELFEEYFGATAEGEM